jgi:predicted MFS family arabinose efflux permease
VSERGASATDALTILFLVNVLNIYDRQALGALLEPLRHDFHLTDTQLGALPAVFTVVYAIAGLPLGRLADTWSRKRLLAIGVAMWAALTALGGLAATYTMLFATRLGVGIGEAVCAPTATSWIGDLVPAVRRSRAMAGFMMAVPVGVMLSFAVTGPVAQAHGWRVALALAAVPAVVLVPALMWLKEPGRIMVNGAKGRPSPLSLLKIPALWWIAASGAIVNFVLYSFSTFISAFLTRFHGLSVAEAGLWSGVGSGAAGILGAIAAGVYGDRMIRKRQNGRVLLAAAAAALAAPLAFAGIRVPAGRAEVAIPLFMLAYGLWQMYYGLVYSAIHDIVPSGLRGTAMAAYYMAMYLCGGSFGPLVTGRLSDHFARQAGGGLPVTEAARAAGLHQAMYVIPVLSVALAAVLWAAGRAMQPRQVGLSDSI